jgi:hypothetical protein
MWGGAAASGAATRERWAWPPHPSALGQVFYYDISPVKVVVAEETQSFAMFVTKICAVIGGIYTVVGLIDNVIYHSGQSIKKMA